MDFRKLRDNLIAQGYSQRTADAKIAHDSVLQAIEAAKFHDHLTVKGGVVMSGLTGLARRATMDMDVDFLHYSLGEASIRRFIDRLNRHSPCLIAIDGPIVELRQQEYRGKRLFIVVTDENGASVRTKIDIGIHSRADVIQSDFAFKVVTNQETVQLLANSREQILVEKLKSLLRLGYVSTRYKDVFDIFYLSSHIRRTILRQYLKLFIYDDPHMIENDIIDIVARLERIFANRTFMNRLSNPNVSWLDVPASDVAQGILSFLASLKKRS